MPSSIYSPCYFGIKSLTSNTNENKLYETYSSDFYITCNGRIVGQDEEIVEGRSYHVVPRLVGGKGGFGSMLRAIGAQIEKTTNREACRDLSGRRMRDVNYEKEMKDWIGKKAEREREKQAEREARKARRRAAPHHKFDDPTYTQQTAVVSDNLTSALHAGLAASNTKKRKIAETVTSKSKKICEWVGVNDDDDSDDTESTDKPSTSASDSDSNSQHASFDSESTNNPGEVSQENNIDKHKEDSANILDSRGLVSKEGTATIMGNMNMKETETKTELDSRCAGTNEHGVDTACEQFDEGELLWTKEPERDSPTVREPTGIQHEVQTSHTTQEVPQVDPFNLERYESAVELEQLGMDQLKRELMDRGLKCGGTLPERAQRLFSVKGLDEGDIDPRLFAKGKGIGKKGTKK